MTISWIFSRKMRFILFYSNKTYFTQNFPPNLIMTNHDLFITLIYSVF